MAEDPRTLDELARAHGTTAVVDCGVAPGLANMIIGARCAQLDRVDDVLFHVGGLPRERRWPYEYKAPFAPSDVIEEYTRPARSKENGKIVVRPALSEPELLDVPGVGTLEAFNTDGLRSLLDTIDAPRIREKTLRWPGHIELMRVLRETGFFGKERIEVDGVEVRPLAMTSKLLFEHWRLEPREREFTYLRVEVAGQKDGREQRFVTTLLDEYDSETDEHSMARTTGFPCTIVLRMLLDGTIEGPGVIVPEQLGAQPPVFDRLVRELALRGVHLEQD
jgi:saccharopine dehydrogenase-like NADP-dependent oxidoreductase